MAETRTVSETGGEKGAKEARFDLIPPFVLQKLAEHYGRGALKYADHNWRKGYKWSLSHAALMRHLNAFWDGEDFDVCTGHEVDCAFEDKEGNKFEGVPGVSCYNHTGNHHLDGVNFHGFALRYFAEYLPEYDDRFTTVTTPASHIVALDPVAINSPIEIYRHTRGLLTQVTDDTKPLCGQHKCVNPNCQPNKKD